MPDDHQTVQDTDDDVSPLQQAVASCTGALVTSFLVTPLDVVKIRLQAQEKARTCFLYSNGLMDHLYTYPKGSHRPGHFTGTIDAFIKIGRNEGVTSLWSGLSPTLVLAIPATIVYFVVYEQLRLKLKSWYNSDNVVRVQPFWIPMISGATARVFSVSLVSPLELIRTKMQSEKISYMEVGTALNVLMRQEGIKGLWRGILPTLFRDVPFSAIYWLHYETIKGFYSSGESPVPFWVSFSAGAIAGSVAAAVTTPFDVVKTHQQIEFGGEESKSGTMEVLSRIYRRQGLRGLFVGTIPRLIRVAPACAIMISTFEYGKVVFKRGREGEKVPFSERYECFDGVFACVPI